MVGWTQYSNISRLTLPREPIFHGFIVIPRRVFGMVNVSPAVAQHVWQQLRHAQARSERHCFPGEKRGDRHEIDRLNLVVPHYADFETGRFGAVILEVVADVQLVYQLHEEPVGAGDELGARVEVMAQPFDGDHAPSDVRACFEHLHRTASLLQPPCGGQAGDARANDDHVGVSHGLLLLPGL